jgi:hypothetical protein
MTSRVRLAFFILLSSLPLNSFLCAADDNTVSNPCDLEKEIVTIDTVVRPGGNFYFQASPGLNDCHATYYMTWRYLDDVDAITKETMPPLDNLAQGFGPAAEFSYFPHPEPTMTVNELGMHIWTIEFSVGNKNSPNAHTEHSIAVVVPTEQSNPSAGPIAIFARIMYVPVPD